MEFSSHLAIQFVDCCKCLVYVASRGALAPSAAFLCIDWVGYCKNLATVLFETYIEEPFLQKINTDNNTESPLMLQ